MNSAMMKIIRNMKNHSMPDSAFLFISLWEESLVLKSFVSKAEVFSRRTFGNETFI